MQDWTKHTDNRIRWYSGTAIYITTITIPNLPKDKKFYLDLGNVMVIVKVKINGQYIGGVWTPLYRVDATVALHEGENALEVEVVSTYMNRIIGDKNPPEAERHIEPTQFPWKYYTPLQAPGLLGPVQVVTL
ncbi:hypothetical protein FACS1894181_05990 [Bacteroidia bacterium]|nr:hypothetical protein FACS1894181_05990 [Bacteroidia bacterium]